MDAPIYNQKGVKTGSVALPASVFGVKWNPDLVHQVVQSMRSSARAGTAHTKMRGEVRGGGRKPWKQKGTGRARHGSIRSPLWVGGGVSHGPRSEKNYARAINKKMKRAALLSVLSAKLRDKEILFLNSIAFPEVKTKDARETLRNISSAAGFEGLAKKKHNAALILTPRKDAVVEKSFRNLGNVGVEEARNLNILDALKYTYLIIVDPEVTVTSFSKILNSKI